MRRRRFLMSAFLATAALVGVDRPPARAEQEFVLRAHALASAGGVGSSATLSLGMTAGLPAVGMAAGPHPPPRTLIELAGFWRWGRLPLPVQIGDQGAILGATAFALPPNEPNPFFARTRVAYAVPSPGPPAVVRLRIYDLSGRLVRVLADGVRAPGAHSVTWDGRDNDGRPIGAGIYFCRMESGRFQASRRLVLTP